MPLPPLVVVVVVVVLVLVLFALWDMPALCSGTHVPTRHWDCAVRCCGVCLPACWGLAVRSRRVFGRWNSSRQGTAVLGAAGGHL